MSDEDLFYKDVEGRMEELKQKTDQEKKKKPEGKRLSKIFYTHLGFNDSDWFTLYLARDFEVGL